jgi:hypothetical protein
MLSRCKLFEFCRIEPMDVINAHDKKETSTAHLVHVAYNGWSENRAAVVTVPSVILAATVSVDCAVSPVSRLGLH